jgi:hypothetical protein
MITYRQGDVLIVAINAKPKTANQPIDRENGAVILAHGEATGHAHAIRSDRAALFRDPKLAAIFLQITEGEMVALEHEEHDTIYLPHGDYEIIRQVEYSPEAIRQVED